MKRRKSRTNAPKIRLVGWEVPVAAAVMVAGLASGTALAAPGDLDPSFAEAGVRSGIAAPGFASLWSVDVQDDDAVIFGGGGEYSYYDAYEDFLGGLTPEGAPDSGFVAAVLDRTAVYDTALQSDGKVVAVGMVRQPDGKQKLQLVRLLRNGALDTTFGLNGLVVLSDGTSNREAAYSVVVDPDDRIVVAGERSQKLLVARLAANGALDSSFGTGGYFTGPDAGSPVRIARGPAGGYRVTALVTKGMGRECTIAGLTNTGALDATFGIGGYAAPPSRTAGGAFCNALASQADGRVLVAGQDGDTRAYIGRLLPNGTVDTGFDAVTAVQPFTAVTALGAGPTGNIVVAGSDSAGLAGALVARLRPDGTLDTSFGRDGTTLIQPKVRIAQGAWINDLKVDAANRIVVGGNAYSWFEGGHGFVARLLGDAGGAGPGVFSVTNQRVLSTEGAGQAVLKVRRIGGSQGSVAVSYATSPYPYTLPGGSSYSPGAVATPGNDYTAATGRLTWADGDASEREIVVPIKADDAVERPEWFEVVLEAPEGGAGLGFYGSSVEIAGSSYPYGEFSIYSDATSVSEGQTFSFYVSRDYYSQGAVSVTVRVGPGGSATAGNDFGNTGTAWQDVVLNWADGELGTKVVTVSTVADGTAESAETLTLEVASPTGGALVGALPQATVQIAGQASPPPANPPHSKSNRGGGSFGWLGAMLLGVAGVLRRYRRPHGGALKA